MSRELLSTQVGCLVLRTACGQLGKHLQIESERLIKKSGYEWFVNRSKAIWNAAIHLRNGDFGEAVQVYQDNSIAYNHKTLYPKGRWGIVVRRFVEAQRDSVIHRYASVLRYYTCLRLRDSKGPTESQVSAMLEAVETPCQAIGAGDYGKWGIVEEYSKELEKVAKYLIKKRGLSNADLTPHFTERDRTAENLYFTSYYYSPIEKIPKQWEALKSYAGFHFILSLITTDWVPNSLDWDTPCREMRQNIGSQGWNGRYAGRLHCIQEQGLKARWVFQPTGWVQLAFAPWDRYVSGVNHKLFNKEYDVWDQNRGAAILAEHLRRGHDAFTVDLKKATDRFPRPLITSYLKSIGAWKMAQAIDELSKEPIRCKEAPGGYVTFQCGTTLGAKGNFHAFCGAHATFAYMAFLKSQSEHSRHAELFTPFPDGTFFHILGDDIVFSCVSVASRYMQFCEECGIKLSLTKCFSGKTAEFAGYLCVPTRHGTRVACFRPYKIPDGKVITNPKEFLFSLGINTTRLGKKWARLWKAFQFTQGMRDIDLEPYLNDEDGRRFRASNAANTKYCMALANGIAQTLGTDLQLPDLSGDPRINRIPLFHEQGPRDWLAYVPDELRHLEMLKKSSRVKMFKGERSNGPLEDPWTTAHMSKDEWLQWEEERLRKLREKRMNRGLSPEELKRSKAQSKALPVWMKYPAADQLTLDTLVNNLVADGTLPEVPKRTFLQSLRKNQVTLNATKNLQQLDRTRGGRHSGGLNPPR